MNCKIKDCKNKVIAKEFCNKHYQRVRVHGDPNKVIVKTRARCSIEGCSLEAHAKNLCFKHYVKFRRDNDLEPKTYKGSCSVEACTGERYGRGLCYKHYKKIWDEENFEERTQGYREYYQEHKEEVTEYLSEWKKDNRGKVTEYKRYREEKVNKATPSWVDREELRNIYQSCPVGHQVDHIVPLINEDVCGLHVPWNLQYLTALENNTKNNDFDGTEANESWRRKLKKSA